jgi:lipopolysaccharide export system protein LptA
MIRARRGAVAAVSRVALLALLLAAGQPAPAAAQDLDLSQGGPVEVTARDGIEWRQNEQAVIARGDARAVRAGVTVEADRLIARYRPRGGDGSGTAPQPPPAAGGAAAASPMQGSEIWRLEAEGDVRISTATDRAHGDRAVYDMDQAVMVLSGRDLWLATPQQRITARDSLEYWSRRRMAVARGGARVESSDGRCITADTLVAHFAENPPASRQTAAAAAPSGGANSVPGEGSKLERVEAFGNIEIRTATEVVRGDRGVYSPVTGMARLLGDVRIVRGDNILHGAEAIVDLRGGTARLVSRPGGRVQGLIVPDQGQQQRQSGAQQQQQQQRPSTAAQHQPGCAR